MEIDSLTRLVLCLPSDTSRIPQGTSLLFYLVLL